MNKIYFRRLFMFFIPLFLSLIVLGSSSIFLSERLLYEQMNKYNLNLLIHSKKNVEIVLEEINSIFEELSNNEDLIANIESVMGNSNLTLSDDDALRLIMRKLDDAAEAKIFINSIVIYFPQKHNLSISSNYDVPRLRFANKISDYDTLYNKDISSKMWTYTNKVHVNADKQINFLNICSRLSLSTTNRDHVLVVVSIFQDYLNNLLNNIPASIDQNILIINETDNKIYDKNLLGYLAERDISKLNSISDQNFTLNSQNNTYLISQLISEQNGWKYLSIVPQSALYDRSIELSRITYSLIGLTLIFGFGITYYMTNKFNKSVNKILATLKYAENNNTISTLPTYIINEYDYISRNVINIIDERHYFEKQLSDKKDKLKTMELITLQSQMNPHFLFNTLQSINWKAYGLTKGRNEVNIMIENLSDMLRHSLESENKIVTMKDEIANAVSYLEIQKIRHGEKLEIKWDYEETVSSVKVLHLIIQPLLENSIDHGLKSNGKKTCIKIRMFIKDNILKIAVIDNGHGMSPERLSYIRTLLQAETSQGDNIGLYNTNRRIKLIYGDRFGIRILSKLGFGTAVYINIPI